jgi:hemolysin activation/secretion protein
MKKRLYLSLLAALLALFLAVESYSQPSPASVDQATREVDRSVREEVEERLTPAPKAPPKIEEKEEPTETEGPKFLVKTINLEGTVSFSAEEFAPIVSKYENREITMEDLNILATSVERDYLRRGIIAACFVPPQDIKEGSVTLRVVEARMGDLIIQEHGRFFSKDRINYYWNIKPGDVLRYDKMSKSIQFMNKNPDRDVNATLHAGKKPGTTDVIMNVKTKFPVHVFASFDREGSVSTGRERTGLGIRHNNFLFADDTLMLGSSFGRDFRGLYAYHTIPITPFGTSVMYGYSDSRSAPKKEYEQYVIKSESQNYSFYINQDLYKKAEYIGEASIGIDANDKTSRSLAGSGTLSRDRLRILRMKTTLIHRFPGAITYMTPQISQGLNWLGARSKNDFSSRGADSVFTKFDLSIRHKTSLPLGVQAAFNLKYQWAGEKLASQEQFALGGIDSVRGYPSQDYMADTGVSTNFELLIPSFWIPEDWKLPLESQTVRDSVTGVLFFDWGYGERRGDIQGEKSQDYLAGAGLGLRIRMFNQALLRLEWGFPVTPFADKPITEAAGSRFHIALDFEDQFYQEFQRIKGVLDEERIQKYARNIVDVELNRADSPVREKMHTTLLLAQEARARGDLKEAGSYYDEVLRLGKSLESQSLSYVQSMVAQREELEKLNRQAQEAYDANDTDKAKELWEKVKTQAEIKPLVFDLR